MHRNPYWLILLAVVGSIVLYCSVDAWVKFHRYHTLNGTIKPIELTWSVQTYGEEEYGIEAHYRYYVASQEYRGQEEFLPRPRNPWAAQDLVKFYKTEAWLVYFSNHNPQDSTLQKSFPLKESISALILWILFVYFLWLGYYVANYKV